MRSRSLACLAVGLTSLAACSPRTTDVPAAAPPATASAPTSSPAIAAPTVAAAPTATAADAPSALEVPPPPSAETLAKLPPGAAIYFAVRLGEVMKGIAALPNGPEIFRQINRELLHVGPNRPLDEALTADGVDVRRSVLGAVVPASEKSARAVIDGLVKGSSSATIAKVRHDHAGDATLVRLLVPLTKGADAANAAAQLALQITRNAKPVRCLEGEKECAGFGAEAPLLVARGDHAAVVAYADGADLRLDVAVPLFITPADPEALAGPPVDLAVIASLVAFRGSRGGFQGRCSRFDAGASASVCADAALAGDFGATTGYAATFRALDTGAVDDAMKKKIAAVGRAESQRNLELAAPARKLASDGTLVITARGEQRSAFVTWALTDASRAPVEKAFSAEKCAAGRAVLTDLFPALRAAFGDPGPGFTDPRKTFEAFREAGWGAYPVVLSGTWPNLLGLLTGPAATSLDVPAALEMCARHEGGRLTLTVKAPR